ncbi:MAG: hypothetical protein JWQ12_1326 [Glaciihabitans sp.]|nr:hypothetical protein [Glaciihabitans sp.]
MGKRTVIAIVAAFVAGVLVIVGYDTFSGNFANVFGQASANASANSAVNSLAARLRTVHGVSSVTVDFALFAMPAPTIGIRVSTRSTATAEDDREVVTLVQGVIAHDVNAYPSTLTIDAPNGSRFTQNHFGMPASTLATKVGVWSALRLVGPPVRESVGRVSFNGPLGVTITAPGASQTELARLIASYSTALPAVSRPGMSWDLPGLQSMNELPPTSVLTELSGIVAKLGLAPADPRALPPSTRVVPLVWAPRNSSALSLGFVGPNDGSSLAHADIAARLFVEAGVIPGFSFYTVEDGGPVQHRFHLGACAGSQAMLPGEADYAAHLRGIGLDLPDGSGPGVCLSAD